jgi:hypothetical protein
LGYSLLENIEIGRNSETEIKTGKEKLRTRNSKLKPRKNRIGDREHDNDTIATLNIDPKIINSRSAGRIQRDYKDKFYAG